MATFWARLFDALMSSTIIQGIVTLALIGANLYLWLSQQEVPQDLAQLTLLVVGFWFGSKVENAKLRILASGG